MARDCIYDVEVKIKCSVCLLEGKGTNHDMEITTPSNISSGWLNRMCRGQRRTGGSFSIQSSIDNNNNNIDGSF